MAFLRWQGFFLLFFLYFFVFFAYYFGGYPAFMPLRHPALCQPGSSSPGLPCSAVVFSGFRPGLLASAARLDLALYSLSY